MHNAIKHASIVSPIFSFLVTFSFKYIFLYIKAINNVQTAFVTVSPEIHTAENKLTGNKHNIKKNIFLFGTILIAYAQTATDFKEKLGNWNSWSYGGLILAVTAVFESYPEECAALWYILNWRI